jgi:acyl-CoA dehydrogenase
MQRRAVFDDEHEAFRDSFGRFVDREIVPGREEWESVGRAPAEVFRQAGDNGFLGMAIPEDHGGSGVADARFGVVIAEELTRRGLIGLALAFTMHTSLAIGLLAAHTDAAQQARWLPALASGERLATVVTTAVGYKATGAGGGRLRLAGAASGVVGGTAADLLVVPARSDAGEHRVVVVDASAGHLRRSGGPELFGVPGADLADVELDGVEVAAADILGGDGDAVARASRIDEQLMLAVIGVAGARAALGWTLDYVRERKVFGRPVAAFENTRYALADVAADITVAEAYLDACVADRVAGRLPAARAATAKLRCTELFGRAADHGMQLHGGYGYMREYPISRAFADARYLRLHGGSAEAMKDLLAADLGL